MMKWLENIGSQIVTDNDPNDIQSGISSVNSHLQKLDSHNKELENQKKLLDNLKNHSDILKQQNPDKALQYEQLEKQVKIQIDNLSAPLENKLAIANQIKMGEQFLQDCDYEVDWMNEKLDLIRMRSKQLNSTNSLQQCLQMQQRHKSVKSEVGNRKTKIQSLLDVSTSWYSGFQANYSYFLTGSTKTN